MSWDYRVDGEGNLVIEVRRWYSSPPPKGKGEKEVLVIAMGFEPFEPVSVEVLTEQPDE